MNPADRNFTIKDDGLAQSWGQDFVWLNAPFGKNRLILWTRKFVQHGNGVILVPERTSTVWYQELEVACDLMMHLDKKVPRRNPPSRSRRFWRGARCRRCSPRRRSGTGRTGLVLTCASSAMSQR